MKSKNQRQCFYCKKLKTWLWNDKRLKDGTKIYTNERNQRWAGKRCPSCEKERVKKAQKFTLLEKQTIMDSLIADGFKIKSPLYPIIASKQGKEYKIGIKRVIMGKTDGIQDGEDNNIDIFALIYSQVGFCNKHKLSEFQQTK